MNGVPLKLLVEENYEGVNYIVEEQNKNTPSNLYVYGPYFLAGKKNGNGRTYDIAETINQVALYNEQMIKTGRAIGELNHPTTPDINPERASHLVVELKPQNDNYFMGKSKVLNTPLGQLTKSLFLDGVKLGISSRSLGQLVEHQNVKNLHLICFDIVHQPSVENAMLDSIMENRSWVVKPDGSIIAVAEKAYQKLETQLEHISTQHDRKDFIHAQLLDFFNTLKSRA